MKGNRFHDGTPGGIRTHGLPLRSFGWAVVLEIGGNRLSLVNQGWRAFYCSFEFVFFQQKSPENRLHVCKMLENPTKAIGL